MKTPVSGACRWFAAAALALACGTAAGQEYPSKPIRFLLPFAPGGIGDLTARVVAQKMSENMGQNVVVDNRPGAGMILSATAALQSAADGYTMVLAGNGTAISASLFKSLPYNILKDFTQVSMERRFGPRADAARGRGAAEQGNRDSARLARGEAEAERPGRGAVSQHARADAGANAIRDRPVESGDRAR